MHAANGKEMPMNHRARELTADELTFVCDPDQFSFKTTDELPNLMSVIGQERAVRAIDFGVQIPSYGFNIYVMGRSGTGRSTTEVPSAQSPRGANPRRLVLCSQLRRSTSPACPSPTGRPRPAVTRRHGRVHS
jgi:hypothetical protein